MAWTMQWLEGQLELFEKERPHYIALDGAMKHVLGLAQKQFTPLGYVCTRVKAAASFAEKCIRKSGKYTEPALQLTDLCGARVVAQSQREVQEVCAFIRQHFIIDEANSEDKQDLLGTSEFGYLSVHFVVQIPNDLAAKLELDDDIAALIAEANAGDNMRKVEIQVRTEVQNFWANGMHDRVYKTRMTIPPEYMREAHRLAAQLESADNSFGDLMERIDAYELDYGAHMSLEQMNHEVHILKTLLGMGGLKVDRPALALQIAKIAKAAGDWVTVVETTSPYLAQKSLILHELQLEHGLALCKICEEKSQFAHADFDRGQELIRTVADPDGPFDGTTDRGGSRIRARALALLAWTHQKRNDGVALRREQFRRACILDPTNPYHLREFLKEELNTKGSIDFLPLVEPQILAAIEMCEDHIRVGIEMPQAQFTHGLLHLLVGKHNECMLSYAKAIGMSSSVHSIDEELDAIALLCQSLSGEIVSKLEEIRTLLLLGRMAKLISIAQSSKGADSDVGLSKALPGIPEEDLGDFAKVHAALCATWMTAGRGRSTLAPKHEDVTSPATIVAGTTSSLLAPDIEDYEDTMLRALHGVEGTVISGGTRSGICGAVGYATDALRKTGMKLFQSYGYLPQLLPADAREDDRYDDLVKVSDHFDHQQVLQYWVDIFASKVLPSNVSVIGVGGGNLSEFEYLLALALQAKVGLVQNSGRKADQLLKNPPAWAGDRLTPLPKDAMTLCAFMLSTMTRTDKKHLEAAARKVHERFSAEKRKKAEQVKKWEELSEDMKHSNYHQVAFAVQMLRSAGLDVRPSASPNCVSLEDLLSPAEIDRLAEMEHGRWNVERLLKGWRKGPKVPEDKTHDCLVPWSELPDDIRVWDYDPVKNLPTTLGEAGLEIYKP